MRTLRVFAVITCVLGFAVAFLLLVPRHVHLAAELQPTAAGEAPRVAPAGTLDCGSVVAPGHD